MDGRRERVAVLGAVLGAAAALSTFLPWGRSGVRWRTSYEVADVAVRADVLPDAVSGLAPLWSLVPALAGALVLAVALRRPLIAGGAATTLGALVGTGSVLVHRSPLATSTAVTAGVLLGAGTALCGAVVLVTARKEKVA